MKPVLPLLYCLLLAACALSDGSFQSADGTRLSVRQDDNYYWPAPVKVRQATGEVVEVEPFPLVTALVVSRADGVALTGADEPAARSAVEAYCQSQARGIPGPGSHFSQGRWAFSPCAEN